MVLYAIILKSKIIIKIWNLITTNYSAKYFYVLEHPQTRHPNLPMPASTSRGPALSSSKPSKASNEQRSLRHQPCSIPGISTLAAQQDMPRSRTDGDYGTSRDECRTSVTWRGKSVNIFNGHPDILKITF